MVASKLQSAGDCFGRLSPKALSRRYRKALARVFAPRECYLGKGGPLYVVDEHGKVVPPEKILDFLDAQDVYSIRRGIAHELLELSTPKPERTVLEWERTDDGWETKCRSFVIAPNGKSGRFVLWTDAGLQIAKGTLKAMKERAQQEVDSSEALLL